jgi:hypothetical protein
MMTDTADYHKLKKVVNDLLHELGFSEPQGFIVMLEDDDTETLRLVIDVKPEALMQADERTTLKDFNSIISSISMEESVEERLQGLDATWKDDDF